MANKIKLARGTKSRIESIKSGMLDYELVYSTDTNELGVKNSDGTVTYFGVVTELEWANILNKPNFATVATSGAYSDLSGRPNLDLKLDKNFTTLPNQATPLLTDVMVINRGSTVQRTTLGALLALVDSEIFIVVANLPATGIANKIYLVPKSTPELNDGYDEFIWKDGTWELLGSLTLDLDNYYNIGQVDGLLSAKVNANNPITAGTHTKITYDAKGLVTGGSALAPSDIPNLDASKINAGTFTAERIPTLAISKVTNLQSSLDNKVDKIEGKGLSTNDFTNNEKNKLDGIEAGAEVNPYSKTQLDGFFNGKVDKVSGKGLSTNDFTDVLKTKLDGVAVGAEVNVQSDWNITDTDNDAFIKNKPAIKTVATTGDYNDLTNKPDLTLKLDKNFAALPTQENPLLTDVLVINRGTAAQKVTLGNILAQVDNEIFVVVATLPTTGVVNKIYLLPKGTPEGQNAYDEYIWVNGAWEKLGTITLDLSNIYNKTEVNGLLSAKVDKNNAITAGTHPKITYDAKGLVTGGAALVAGDIPNLNASKINAGTFDDERIPSLAASKIGSGTFDVARIPNLAPTKITQNASNRFVTDIEKASWDGKQDKLVAGENITIEDNVISASGGGGIDLDEMAYFNYASSIYGAKYSLLANAWQDMKEVDGAEIERSSTTSTQYGRLQYPNGEVNGVIIPDSVTSIGEFAFYGWSSNNQPLVIPNNVTSIGYASFYNWSSNNQPLVIPNSVAYIGDNAFDGWSSNNHPLVISHGVTSISFRAFYNWSSNNQPLVIPNSVTSIGGHAFRDWSSNNQPLVIPNSVTSIGTNAFYGWSSNNQPLVIPDSVTSIGHGAFRGWTSNNQPLVIPDSVTSIGHSAFYDWSLVPYVELQAITPPTLANASAFSGQNNVPIYVPDESVDAYKTATNWVNLADRIFSINDK